jgi:hypothetical protein
MAIASLLRKVKRLQALVALRNREPSALALLLDDPTQVLVQAKMNPDPWQDQVLRSRAPRMLLLASRQAGKSSVAAALALHTALVVHGSPVLLLSPSLRQSGELFRKVVDLFNALGRPATVLAENKLQIEFASGSRILSLPGTEGTVRGFSEVALLIIDEAARVDNALYVAVRPMLAVSRGRLVALSTPFGKRGWFHDEWHGDGAWERVRITAEQCPRITAEFLAEERQALGERWYRQEYGCSFEDTIDAVFSHEDIRAALSSDVKPLFENSGT